MTIKDLLISRLGFGKKSRVLTESQQLLAEYLENYPPTPIVHKGLARQLTVEQAKENLSAFLDSVPARLESLQNCLEAVGIRYPNDLALNESRDAVNDIYRWAGETWPVFGEIIGEGVENRWFSGERDDECAIFSVATDVATLLGEIVIHSRPTLHWGVDLDAENLRHAMPSVRRVVLTAPWREETHDSVIVDLEYVVVHQVFRQPARIDQLKNRWLETVEGACRGGYEGVGVVDL